MGRQSPRSRTSQSSKKSSPGSVTADSLKSKAMRKHPTAPHSHDLDRVAAAGAGAAGDSAPPRRRSWRLRARVSG